MQKRKTKINIQYFKPSGKFYTEEKLEMEVDICDPTPEQDRDNNFTVYMPKVCDWIKECNQKGELPGLSSGGWEGYVYVDAPDNGYPCLVRL